MACKLGERAVDEIKNGIEGVTFLSIQLKDKEFTANSIKIPQDSYVKDWHRLVHDTFYDPDKLNVTYFGREYLRTINQKTYNDIEYGLEES